MSRLRRLANLIGRRDLTPEIDEELQFHVDSRIDDNLAAGMSPEEARREALARFGSRPAAREAARDTHAFVFLETLLQDVRYAVRILVHRPLFTVVALATLSLGIGANTAVFTIVRSVLLRPLPFPEPDRLFVITNMTSTMPVWLYPSMPDADYLQFRDWDRTFESTATFGASPATLTGAGDAVRLNRVVVTPEFFRVLGVSPAGGRDFVPGDDRVVLVSEHLWRSRFGGDPGLVNRTITLDGVGHTVAGILPAGFQYPRQTDVWTPLTVTISQNLSLARPVIGRLRPGVTRSQAAAMIAGFRPAGSSDGFVRLIPLRDAMVGETRRPLLIFSGAVAFVLLIACANVANLLLMRAVSRRHEIATRLSLGASRARVVRQLLTESVMLSIGGGLAGLTLAYAAVPALLALMPPGRLPSDLDIRVDPLVLWSTLGLSILTGLLLGLTPAIQATQDDLSGTLRDVGASLTTRSHRLRHGLVVVEVALALMLLVGAGLLMRSFLNLRSVETGFDPANVMTMTVDLEGQRYGALEGLRGFHDQVLTSLRTIPGVQTAAAVNWIPLGSMLLRGDFIVEDGREVPGGYIVTKASVSPQYFKTMGIRLISGRDFAERDGARAEGVAIISQSVAARIWPGESPVGKRLSLEDHPRPQDWLTIVGIVDDIRQSGVKGRYVPAVYQPYQQCTRRGFLAHMAFVVRTADHPERIAPMMRGALRAADSTQAPQTLVTLETVLADTIAEPRFQSRLLGVFSLIALVLSALGIYGVLAFSVMERKREIGIRVALGANRARVMGMVLRRTVLLAAAGIGLGLIGALATASLLTRLLFNVAPTDGTVLAGAAAALMGVALLAGLLPARKASSVDPLVALRSQ